jgi:FkbM family methyltransferase
MRDAVKRWIHKCGYEVHRYNIERSSTVQFLAMLRHHAIDCVLDVGANAGQFGRYLREGGYEGRIISFEPLSSAHGLLTDAARHDSLWDVHARTAIGATDGEIEINIANNSFSSSILGMLDQHSRVAPASRYVGTESVSIRRLDSLALTAVTPETRTFLKIDTQGYESQVLDGAPEMLRRVRGVQLEMSLVPLYEGQVLFRELESRIHALGFEFWSVSPQLVDPATGRMLQVDATFFRPD